MRPSRSFVLGILLLVAAGPSREAGAWHEIDDLGEMAGGAALIVKAKVVKKETRAAPEDLADVYGHDVDVATLAVEKVLFGTCDRLIRVRYDPKLPCVGLDEVGAVCYLCLIRVRSDPRTYREWNRGLTVTPVKNGKVDLSHTPVPKSAEPFLKRPTPEAFEQVLRWLRGLKLTVAPGKIAARFDEPIVFDATLTNTSSLPMKLDVGSGPGKFSEQFRATLWDGRGFAVGAARARGPASRHTDDEERAHVIKTLAPGGSVTGKLRFLFRPRNFVQDPTRATTIAVTYQGSQWFNEVPKVCWPSRGTIECPARLACPDRRWAAELQQPSGELSACLMHPDTLKREPMTTLPKQPIKVRISLKRRHEECSFLLIPCFLKRLDPAIARGLASCLRVERDGRSLPRPRADRSRVAKWLAQRRRRGLEYILCLDLAKHLAFDRPGTYRVRLALPGATRPSLSNVLEVLVPEKRAEP